MDAEGMKPPPEGTPMPPMMQQMMEKMMASMHECGPMGMCRAVMATVEAPGDVAADAPRDVRALFEEWTSNVEREVLEILRARGPLDLADLAAALKISRESALHFLGRLVREGKATLSGTRAAALD